MKNVSHKTENRLLATVDKTLKWQCDISTGECHISHTLKPIPVYMGQIAARVTCSARPYAKKRLDAF